MHTVRRGLRPRSRRFLAGLTLLGLLAAGATTDALLPASASAAGAAPAFGEAAAVTSTVPRPDHVVVVGLENKNRTGVVGSSSAPYLNSLAARGGNMTQSFGVTHPSQPNYLALSSGDQHGVTDDACRDLGAAANLGSQLRTAGLSFTGFSESLPQPGYTGCASGQYKRKHNPWINFSNLPAEVNQPFTAFPTDYSQLATVSFVTPNMCHDMHDCSVATGDAWLETQLAG